MTAKRRRLTTVIAGLAALGVAAALVLSALRENIVFFFAPSELDAATLTPGQSFRLGGLVETGSLTKDADGTVHFALTDGAATIPVVYDGSLPDLFREGQGVIARGRLAEGVFRAREVLAKHDENYMPPEVAEALKKTGHWKTEYEAGAAP